ncbi:MAG: peptidase M16 [Hyphomicrobium sp. 32-62-53]|nr:MAG: peptidase M16 [Hyphomicrobium sp. 12-62-95]OYX97858.1 MAG: peptidase M16 [Hyphomicrobium sp. 32-62-53]
MVIASMFALAQSPTAVYAAPRITEFKLDNGMQVVVIPDTRSPVVTHMVWYKVGAADEPKGVSGIAHFLEHLMFKSTESIPSGEFSKIVSRLGGQDNAFTGHDVTSYFQRISKDRLRKVMEMEADRMANLKLVDKEVLTERDVILEERRSRIENNPAAILDEQMDATLYLHHPYGVPVIGWEHEMAQLSRDHAMTFYKRYYAPNNAILVVAGDVTPEEVKKNAIETYGKLSANPAAPRAVRPADPPQRVARRVMLEDPRAGKASIHRDYLVPSYSTAAPLEAEALDLLAKIALDGPTSRLYKKLVVEDKVASSAGGSYMGSGLDSGKFSLYAVAADGAPLEKVEAAIDAVLADVAANGVTAAELDRAKNGYVAEYIYENDNQSSLARRYGWGLSLGRTIPQIEGWPDEIRKVTLDDIKKAAAAYIDARRSVTGVLKPLKAPVAEITPAKSRS